MTEIKSCISCAHYEDHNGYPYCSKFTFKTIDYVEGREFINFHNCIDLRKFEGKCGPDAIGWELAPPEKKMSMMDVILDFLKFLSPF
jgi:hypothetical protein